MIAPPLTDRERRLPALLPVLYFGFAYLSLAVACGELAIEPRKVAGFFYHPRMIAVVHLVTLGWISGSILGALHLVGPMALRTPMPARRSDYWAFAAFALGASGVVSHFWIEEFSGVAWSGLLLVLVFLHVGRKLLGPLRRAPVPAEVKAHFVLAFSNVALAAVAGTLLGLNKHWTFLPGSALAGAYAHAHLAALGWATMMVFAAGYRLLPMLLPAAMPTGAWVWASAALLEAGTLGLFTALWLRGPWLAPAAVCAAAAVAAFLGRLAWMKRHRRPAPKGLIRPDFGVAQALCALAYLALAAVLGLALAFAPETTEETLRLAAVYGVCGLLGFLAQMIAGVGSRLLPIFAYLVSARTRDAPPTPHETPDRRLQAAAFALWTAGVPALAAGFWLDRVPLVSAGGWIMLAAVVTGAAGHLAVLAATRREPPDGRLSARGRGPRTTDNEGPPEMKISEMTDVEKQALGSLVRVMVSVDGRYSPEESAGMDQAAAELGEDEFWQVVEAAAHEHHTEEIVKDQARAVERKEAQERIYEVLFALAVAGSIAREEGDLLDWLAGAWDLAAPA